MRQKSLDLIAVTIIAALNVAIAFLPVDVPTIRIIVALPLVFFVPGYALTEVLFHKHLLDASHRLALSIGLSMAVAIISGLLINFFPMGMGRISWTLFLVLLTVLLSLITAYLRRKSAPNGARSSRFRLNLSIAQGLSLGFAVIIAVLAVLYSIIGVIQQPHPGFTQLWLLPPMQSGSCTVRLGMRNFEATPLSYSLTVSINGKKETTWSSITLVPSQEWSQVVTIAPPSADSVSIQAQLYRLDKPQAVYREADMTLSGFSGGKDANLSSSCLVPQPTQSTHSTSSPYPVLSNAYSGTIYDLSAHKATTLFFRGIQQSEGNIKGEAIISDWMQGKSPLNGTITITKHVQFLITDSGSSVSLAFDGDMLAGGGMSGSYCQLTLEGQCNSAYGYGLWSIAPTS